ncbi:arrestin domain-containing protein 3-like [Lutzomyia longipalpis]|uniref:arrestin domain-containing protein 3-like n=1 Tax=Lutzomyia longipalpis TaxID=7200 RepID=UPI0024839306|nr:arrestin domain-containing protein 3-like [Lutzomyia longipalpis]
MVNCTIILDKYTYIAGEEVTGRVEITNSNSITIRNISLVIKGSGKVEWSESESYTENGESKTRWITYSSHEQYLNSRTILYGQVDGPNISLQPGNHSFDFKCFLPPELPGSMFGSNGRIDYNAKVKFDIPWSLDNTFEKTFNVVTRVDLNSNPIWNIAVENEKVKNYCTWKCSTSPAVITVTLPKTGFVKHEKLKISVHISNLSHVEMEGLQTKLVRTTRFKSTTPSRKEKSETSKVVYKRFDLMSKSKDRVIELDASLEVPDTLVTCDRSDIITVSYVVEVAVYVSGCHNTARLYIPVTIGSIPMAQSNAASNQQPTPHAPLAPMPPVMPVDSMPIMPPLPPGSIPTQTPYPSAVKSPTAPVLDEAAPPPSYSEVVYGWKTTNDADKK